MKFKNDENRKEVYLMTIHRSKGLEYDRVWFVEQLELQKKIA